MKYICLIFIFFQTELIAQISPGPRSLSMGSAGVALKEIWSLQHNSAGIAEIRRPIFAVGYERHFSDQDLSTQKAVFAIPYKQHVFGLSIHRYGINEYSDQTAGIAYSRNFSGALALSIMLNYHQLSIHKYGESSALSMNVIHKVLNATIDTKLGLEYRLIKWFALRGGMSANPFKQYAGFGLQYHRFALDVASSSHPNLGYSPNLAFSYEF